MRDSILSLSAAVCLLFSGCGGGGGTAIAINEEGVQFTEVSRPVGKGPEEVRLADLDCDGDLDLVTLDPSSTSVTLSLTAHGDRRGAPENTTWMIVWDDARDLAVADLDQDGRPDVAVAGGSTGMVSTHLSSRARPEFLFSEPVAFSAGLATCDRIAVGDVNGDGAPDLVCMDESDGTITVVGWDPVAKAWLPANFKIEIGKACRALVLADLDRDGKLDACTTHPGGTLTCVDDVGGAAAPTELTLPFVVGNDAPVLAVGDLTGDGWPDLCVREQAPGACRLAILRNARGAFRPSFFDVFTELSVTGAGGGGGGGGVAGGVRVAVGDVDGDGRADVVVNYVDPDSDGDGIVYAMEEVAIKPIRLEMARLPSSDGEGGGLALGDLDGDGKLDVVCCDRGADAVTVHFQGGLPPGDPDFDLLRTAPIRESPTLPGGMRCADLDRDGRLDVCLCEPTQRGVEVLFQEADGSFTPVFVQGGGSSSRVALGDLNGDGCRDMVVTNGPQAQVGVILRDPASERGFLPVVLFDCPDPHGVAIGDVNGDGLQDVCVASHAAGAGLRIFLRAPGGAAGPFALPPLSIDTLSSSTTDVAIGDDDCDGDPDFFCANADGTATVVSRLNGLPPGTPYEGQLSASTYQFAGGVRVAVGDVNGDGAVDFVCCDGQGLNVTYGRKADDDTIDFAPAFALTFEAVAGSPGGGDPDFDLADLNGDGRPDLVARSSLASGQYTAVCTVTDEDGDTGTELRSFVLPHVLEKSGRCLATGDFDGDGGIDLVTTGPSATSPGGDVYVWKVRK